MPEPTSHRSKAVLLTAEDMRVLSEALAVAWPEARYYMGPKFMRLLRKTQPHALLGAPLHRIWRASCRWRQPVHMVLDPTWTPIWYWDNFSQKWQVWPMRHPSVTFQSIYGHVHHQGHPPEIAQGSVSVACNPGFKEHSNFASRFFRLLGKFASNKDLEEVHWPSGKPVEYATDKPLDRLGPWRMVGHDARRWALDDPTRVLEYNSWRKTALRPVRK